MIVSELGGARGCVGCNVQMFFTEVVSVSNHNKAICFILMNVFFGVFQKW